MSEWSRALDLHLDAIRWWQTEMAVATQVLVWTEALEELEEKAPARLEDALLERFQADARMDTARTAELLNQASTFWVSDEMATVMEAAAASLPPTNLREDMVPTQHGFVMFERLVLPADVETMKANSAGPLPGFPFDGASAMHWTSLGGDPAEVEFTLYAPFDPRRVEGYSEQSAVRRGIRFASHMPLWSTK